MIALSCQSRQRVSWGDGDALAANLIGGWSVLFGSTRLVPAPFMADIEGSSIDQDKRDERLFSAFVIVLQ